MSTCSPSAPFCWFREGIPAPVLTAPPAGWHVAASTPLVVTWVRDQPVAAAGRPVWWTPGATVSEVSADDRTVRFTVGEVPDGGASVVLSRLAWPGYSTDLGSWPTRSTGTSYAST